MKNLVLATIAALFFAGCAANKPAPAEQNAQEYRHATQIKDASCPHAPSLTVQWKSVLITEITERTKISAAAARATNQSHAQNATQKRKAAHSIMSALITTKAAQATKHTPVLVTNTKI